MRRGEAGAFGLVSGATRTNGRTSVEERDEEVPLGGTSESPEIFRMRLSSQQQPANLHPDSGLPAAQFDTRLPSPNTATVGLFPNQNSSNPSPFCQRWFHTLLIAPGKFAHWVPHSYWLGMVRSPGIEPKTSAWELSAPASQRGFYLQPRWGVPCFYKLI